ncbi:hypothetical protein K4F52_009539, partial [Lecanicillium sp. MT-2017a]
MSSIVTAVPTGVLQHWCLGDVWDFDGQPRTCGNGTKPPSDFWSVCCDGEIFNVNANIWTFPANMTLDDLICCRHIGRLEGGLHPLPQGPPFTCDLGAVGTPLASLAATNTDNAGAYVATYAKANYEFGSPPTDMLWTETPRCLWVETKSAAATGLRMEEVTVPAAMIVPLSTTVIRGVPPDTSVSSTSSLQSTESPTTMMLPTTEVNGGKSTITSAPPSSSESADEGP